MDRLRTDGVANVVGHFELGPDWTDHVADTWRRVLSRHGLLVAAANEVTQRAGAEAAEHGFPPTDLASRRGDQLAKAMARIRLDSQGELFAAHPVSSHWKRALLTSRPELLEQEIDTMVATASAPGLGWALFSSHLCEVLELDDGQRITVGRHIERLVAELGGLPTQADSGG